VWPSSNTFTLIIIAIENHGKTREERNMTHLEQIGKVDKHVISCLFLPASDVETDGDDVEALTALGEFMFHRESVKPSGG
jgi:hypothetical protein